MLYIFLLNSHNALKWFSNVDLKFMLVLFLSIIRFLEPLIGDIFKTCFEVCHFNETIVPPLGGEKSLLEAQREKVFPPLKGEKSVSEARLEIS
jgi:hypothetical protein